MSVNDPQAGDVFFHATLSGGCEVRVLKRGIRKGWGEAVWVDLVPQEGTVKHPRRTWSMVNWPVEHLSCPPSTPEKAE